ncbi:hypothetical protein ACS0TY_024930 [Phlomoides rotata]
MVREWLKREVLVEAVAVKGVVMRLMSEEGEEVRNRAAEISATVRESVEEGAWLSSLDPLLMDCTVDL